MAERIVDEFELVDVEQQNRQRPIIALKALPRRRRQFENVGAIIETGHAVGRRQLVHVGQVLHQVGDVGVSQMSVT